MRILFGIGWLLAGVTKITEKSWFTKPCLFLREYLVLSLENDNVSPIYKLFIEKLVLEYVIVFNYIIPIVQILLGLFLIVGLFTLPSILACLFMHINFILSGNMNVLSLILYTSAFSLIIFRTEAHLISLDKYIKLDFPLAINRNRRDVSMLTNKKNAGSPL
jgi:thiosulfate dehydrogenase [quinone] large subunit